MDTAKNRLASVQLAVFAGAAWLFCAAMSLAGTLDSLSGRWPEANLRASLDPAGTLQVEQGSNFQVRITSDREASVLLVLVSPESKARVLVPHREGTADRVVPGTEMLVPDLLSGETLYADMPEGKATVYVIASSDPLLQRAPADAEKWMPLASVEGRLAAAVASHRDVHLAVSRIPVRIATPAVKEFISTEEFVQFFGVATRSVTNVERGFAVQFAYNSADLTDWGRRQLDAVGHGMTDARLVNDRFLIEGHTDDIGTEEYNLNLSQRRAASVTRYLNELGVKTGRLKAAAVGKKDPAVAGTSDEARAANRRVVIRRLDGPK